MPTPPKPSRFTNKAPLELTLKRRDIEIDIAKLWDGSPIVIRKVRLIFSTIPKVACEEFTRGFSDDGRV
jgi:hypothetical protein